jgi:hypothetical protein
MSKLSFPMPKSLGLVRDLPSSFYVTSHQLLPAKAYHIKQTIRGWYYYPRDDGQGEVSVQSRPLKAGEIVRLLSHLR